MFSPRRSVSIDTGAICIIKSPAAVRSAPQPQKDPTSPVRTHKSTEQKVVPMFPKETVKRIPTEQPNVDEMEDDLDVLDDLDDLEDDYMGVPLRNDEACDNSDASGHVAIETMALQGQNARNSRDEFDHDYMPSV